MFAAAVVAAGLIFFFLKSLRNYRALPELPRREAKQPPQDVIVIIPARNEEQNVARVIQSFPPHWTLVVDDHSTDRTVEVARVNGAEVIAAPALPFGFIGKPNACAAGAKATQSDWILFADADTWYSPEFLNSLLDYAEQEQLEMLSVYPERVTESAIGKLLAPYALALFFCGIDARRINDPRSPDALTNGQCLLVRRKFYDFIGTHAAVARSFADDIDLAARAKRHRAKIRLVRAEPMAFVRAHDNLQEIWRGISRRSYRLLRVNTLAGFQVIVVSILAFLWLPILIWLALDRQWIALPFFAVVPAVALAPWYGNIGRALLAPVAIYLVQLMGINGILCGAFGASTIWKGRRI